MVYDRNTGEELHYNHESKIILSSRHKGGNVNYQLAFRTLTSTQMFASHRFIHHFMASNYSDPLLYRLEDYKELTCDLPNFKFGLQPMRTNYIFITPGCKPVIQRFCIIEGL